MSLIYRTLNETGFLYIKNNFHGDPKRNIN